MANFIYAIGPWIKRTQDEMSYWDAPDHANGRICFGSLLDCATLLDSFDSRRIGFFCFEPDYIPSLDYLVLGKGDCREIRPSDEIKNSAAKLMTVKPEGDYISDWLGYWLFESGDPTGETLWKTGTPTRKGEYEVYLAGHSKIWSNKFLGIKDKRWNRLRDLLRKDLKNHDDECKTEAKALKEVAENLRKHGKVVDADSLDARVLTIENHASSILDVMCKKYLCQPEELSTEIQRGIAKTTITDSFGGDLSAWTGLTGTWTTASGQLKQTATTAFSWIKHNTTLSGTDHYAQIYRTSGNRIGSWCRAPSGLTIQGYTASPYGATLYLHKWSHGSGYTQLGTATDATGTDKTNANGSSITGSVGAYSVNVTDTSYSSGTYTGCFGNDSQNHVADNFEASDLVVPTNPKSPLGGIMFNGPLRRNVF